MPAIEVVRSGPIGHLRNNAAEWWFKDPGLLKLAPAIFIGFMSSVNMGYDASLINGLLANPRFVADLHLRTSSELGMVVSFFTLGSIASTIPAPIIADRFGRRVAMFCGYTLVIAGSLTQTFTTGGMKMLGGRIIVGCGVGMAQIGGNPYLSEIAHPRNRTEVTALGQTCFYIGAILAAWTTFGSLSIPGSWSWRMCTLLQIAVPIICIVSLPFLPESPRWLVSRGRIDDAHNTLAKYHANGDKDDELVLFELDGITEAIRTEQNARKATPLEFFATKGNRHRGFIVIMCGILSQWAGNGILMFYLVPILNSVGMTDSTKQTAFNGGLQVFNWLASVGGSLVSERVGRRKLWLGATIGMLASFIVLTACSAVYAEKGTEAAGSTVLAFLFIFYGMYAVGYTPLVVAYSVEILPFHLRTTGMGLLTFTVGCMGFFNAYINPIALDSIAWKYYFVYIGILSVALVVIWFCFPETKGRTLEEIETVFDGHDQVTDSAPSTAVVDKSDLDHVEVLEK
ncbi:hypothetical protein CspeluHIS016_0212060 [Cutaneotrichosporon spelunceum]|uniref:Major facilitator superfamily (MFS) profile domain-containing protein n=1 Tax=Cutaneotrichosporon spelunceum TaxID=1672016 RepID=A0AAD3YAL9_9TREE|nr:hypothetical protein CspeluHIS016_0212060 [Cutaneotrichosporon spelunceum]